MNAPESTRGNGDHLDPPKPPPLDLALDNPRADASHSHVPIHARSGTGIIILVLVLLLAVVLGATFFLVSRNHDTADRVLKAESEDAADEATPVNVVRVQYAPSSRTLSLPGETRAWYETTIYARVSGYLKKWNVDIGDSVKEGQELANIETPELDQQLAAAQHKMESEKAQINLAEANVHFTEVTLARYKDAPKGIVSDLERDQKEADYQISEARLAAAQSDLEFAKADVERISAMIAFKKVTAPFSGVITQRHADIGDLVTAGSTANTTSLFRLAQTDRIRVFADVPQSVAPDIHDGDTATATAAEYPDRQFTGVVSRNARSIDPSSKTLRVEVDIPNADYTLLPGMYVNIQFHTQPDKPTLAVPASAMNFRSGGPSVAVVTDKDLVEFRPVTIARDMGNFLEIASGLSPRDRVILNISNQIAPGDRVKSTEIEDPAMPANPVPAVSANIGVSIH